MRAFAVLMTTVAAITISETEERPNGIDIAEQLRNGSCGLLLQGIQENVGFPLPTEGELIDRLET